MGGVRRMVLPAALPGSCGRMAVAEQVGGRVEVGGSVEVLGGAVIRDCWLLRSV